MEINGVYIEDTFAEAFPIWVSRVLITAATKKWAKIAATEATGFGCSVIMCPAEAGIEKYVPPSKTPDGRPGFIIQICHPKKSELEHQMLERLGQCVLTCPTTAIFDAVGDMADEQLKVGFKLKFFGDGYEKKDELYGRKVYKIPIMGGEFITEAKFGIKKGVAGGNFFIMADTNASAPCFEPVDMTGKSSIGEDQLHAQRIQTKINLHSLQESNSHIKMIIYVFSSKMLQSKECHTP